MFLMQELVFGNSANFLSTNKHALVFAIDAGNILIYVYNKKAPIREFADDYIRSKTTKMSVSDCAEFSKDMTISEKSLSGLKKITIPRDIKLLIIKAGTYDVQRSTGIF